MVTALVTGITGQDGYYLARLLLSKGYGVVGLVRGQERKKADQLACELPGLRFVQGDLTDQGSLFAAVAETSPDEVYNLGAMSHVGTSFKSPEHTADVTGLGCLRMLEAVRLVKPDARFYQASSSEMFGSAPAPQNEDTSFHPRSPYGCAKLFAHSVTVNYREAYGLHASCGILFNHESERRGPEFVTRKITLGLGAIYRGETDTIELGNLSAYRDWGHAEDYVRAMWLMLQQDTPGDYVVGTGVTRSVADFLSVAIDHAGVGVNVGHDPAMFRPADVNELRADATKARALLGWSPTLDFEALVARMVAQDVFGIPVPDAA